MQNAVISAEVFMVSVDAVTSTFTFCEHLLCECRTALTRVNH